MPKTSKSAGGIGESKVFGGSDAPSYLEDLHIEGKRIGDAYTADQIQILQYAWTDEAVAERNAAAAARGTLVDSAARVTGGFSEIPEDFEKAKEQRHDFKADEANEVWEAPDILKSKADRYVKPGMRPKFISPDRQELGAYELVKDGNGNQVKAGRLLLAQMPEAKARARNEYYRKLGAQQQAQIIGNAKEQASRLARDTKGVRGRFIKESSPDSGDGLQVRRGNAAETETY